MLYPKEFQKTADAAAAALDELAPTAIGYIRKVNRLNGILHDGHSPDLPTQEELAQAGQQPLYVIRDGRLYPSAFGFSVPVELIPRKIEPIIRNLPHSEL